VIGIGHFTPILKDTGMADENSQHFIAGPAEQESGRRLEGSGVSCAEVQRPSRRTFSTVIRRRAKPVSRPLTPALAAPRGVEGDCEIIYVSVDCGFDGIPVLLQAVAPN
jgi:hypothetical protein